MKSKFKYFWGLMVFTFFIITFPHLSDSATITYTYDNLNRLTKVVYGDGTTEEFTYDSAGNRLTHTIKDNIPPSPPQNIKYSGSGFGSIRISWDPNTDSDLAGYKVYYGKSSGNYENSIDVGNVTAYNLSGLIPGITYYITVTSYDTSGNESASLMEISGAPKQGLLYDDFSGEKIDLNKWRYGEFVREIREFNGGDYKLYLQTITPNPSVMKTFPYNVRNNIGFTNPNSINSIQAQVTIIESNISGTGRTYTYLGGRFYNDGTSGGGYAGDIWAEVSIRRASDGLSARYYIAKYITPDGTTMQDLKWGTFSTLITVGTPYILYIDYNPSINQFTFKVESETITVMPSELPPRAGPPNMPWKGLHTVSRAYNPTDTASLSATFDDVYVNSFLYDDFSSEVIDSSKWVNYEFVREIMDGKLRSGIRSSSASSYTISNRLEFIDPSLIDTISAKATLLDRQNEHDIDSVSAYIGGIYYNDGTPGGGYMGDVLASVGIGGSGINPTAGWRLSKFTDYTGQNTETVASSLFSTPINLGDTYDLFIQWDGSKFTFKLNDEVDYYSPITSINTPNNPRRELTTIIRNPGGKEGMIEALFDDVYIGITLKEDFDRDGDVDGLDLAVFASEFGRTDCNSLSPCKGDLDSDGDVDKDDLALFAEEFGKTY